MDSSKSGPRVVIVGAGFAGLNCARALEGARVRLTVVDRHNHHLFQPLLYQVATAALTASEIASPIRSVLAKDGVEVLLAEAVGLDLPGRKLLLRDGQLSYDWLVVATGSKDAFFGHPEWADHTCGLKSLEDALEIRRRILLAFEAAERESDPVARREWMTFVLIGGGPTGVEMAGALAEISRSVLARDFRHIDPALARIVLLEGLPRVLPPYPPELSGEARRHLEKRGVQVRVGAMVTDIDEDGVWIGNERIAAKTVIWSAGVEGTPLGRALGQPLAKAARVKVTKELNLPDHPEIFVVGDLAWVEQDGKPLPAVAPAAIQMGKHAALNIRSAVAGVPMRPFRYKDRGQFAVVGRGAAVGTLYGKLMIDGALAWFAWLGIHIVTLIGFRSRLLVLFDWFYSFVTRRRGARLITAASRDASEAPMYLVSHKPHALLPEATRMVEARPTGNGPGGNGRAR